MGAVAHLEATAGAGWLLATMPVGMFLGDLAVGRFCAPATRERPVRPLLLLMGLPLLPLAVHPPLILTAGPLGLASAGFAYQLGRQQAFLDAVPPPVRGLAFGQLSTGLMTGQGLGPAVSGALGGPLGAGPTMALAGVGITATALLLHRSTRPQHPATSARQQPVAPAPHPGTPGRRDLSPIEGENIGAWRCRLRRTRCTTTCTEN